MTPAQCRAARALLDWSQQDLAGAAGVGIVTIRQFEAGVGSPRNATTQALMNTLEAAGLEFLAGNGAGPGVRLKEDANSLEQFLAFLKLYERNRLRTLARHANPLPQFGYVFVYHNREGADLMYRGQRLGLVRWRDGRISFTPPLPPGTKPLLSDDTFDAWVSHAEYRNATGT
jgi:transcriptional regulator with XRE-family HTH domain